MLWIAHRDFINGAFRSCLINGHNVQLLGSFDSRVVWLLLQVNYCVFWDLSKAVRVDDLVAFKVLWLNKGLTLRL